MHIEAGVMEKMLDMLEQSGFFLFQKAQLNISIADDLKIEWRF